MTLKAFLEGLKRHGLLQDYALFHSLYTYGFRIQELSKCHEWKYADKETLVCQPSKKSKLRYFAAAQAHPLLLKSVQAGKNLIYISSYSTYRRLFEERVKGKGFYIKEKKVSTHIFRHALAKRMYEGGSSPMTIQKYLGLNSLEIALGYIHSDIFSIEK